MTNRQHRARINLASRHAAMVLNQVVESLYFCVLKPLYFCQVVEMVKMESLVEEAMQVIVEQELEVEELPATLQVDIINIRPPNFVFLYFYHAACQIT